MDVVTAVGKSPTPRLPALRPRTPPNAPPSSFPLHSPPSRDASASAGNPAALITLEQTRQLHARLLRTHFRPNPCPPTLPAHTTSAAWLTSLITYYTAHSLPRVAYRVYAHARCRGEAPADRFSLPAVLKACGRMRGLRQGEEAHGYSVKLGMDAADVFVGNALVRMYCDCGRLGQAMKLFEGMPERDGVSWGVMILGCCEDRRVEEAVSLVRRVMLEDVRLGEGSMLSLLGLFGEVGQLQLAKGMHAYIVKRSGENTAMSTSVGTAMVDMYVKCGSTVTARKVFDRMPDKNTATWTSMAAGHIRANELDEGLRLLLMMRARQDTTPNEITMLSLAIECGSLGNLPHSKWLHAYMLRNGFPSSLVLATSLVDMYGKCGDVKSARHVFDCMSEKDVMTWTAMISGYARSCNLSEALSLFNLMKREKVKPNGATMVTLLSACGEAGALDIGKWIHASMGKEREEHDLVISTALVDMYAKCGDLDTACRIFEATGTRDLCLWNAMISGLALNGCGHEALRLFFLMEEEGIIPNNVTCIGILHGCSHSGLVAEGKQFFNQMVQNYRIVPEIQHYGCMVDLLSRAGLLDEAYDMIINMPIPPNVAIWGALLAGCKLHKNARMAEEAARRLSELEPHNCGYNVLLSNIYALGSRWDDVANVRRKIRETWTKKPPGLSFIEVNGSLHEFSTGDSSHPQSDRIHNMITEMNWELKAAGYFPMTSSVLLNIEEEEKETALSYHSERLAMAFGLISTAPGTTLRIVKNLRVCNDCHEATKLLSKIYGRMVIVRDRNRFHHFKEGICSCGDYW